MAVEGVVRTHGEDRSIQYRLDDKARTITVDQTPVVDRAKLVQNVPCVVFCHDDLSIVTGAPEVHRWFFDQTAALVDHHALEPQRRYQRILRLRNSALRERMYDLLPAYDTQLADAGSRIVTTRVQLVGHVSKWLSQLFSEVFQSDQSVQVTYQSSWPEANDDPDIIVEHLTHTRERDTEMVTTTSGPHRDRFRFQLGSARLAEVGSTGQLRLVSLLLRVVQARLITEQTGRLPVLLLDDVLLELDPRRRERMLDVLPDYDQAFFTFLPDERYARYSKESTRVFTVNGGRIEAAP